MAQKSLTDRRKTLALGDGLRSMFRALEKRPVPEKLIAVVEQLDERDAPHGRKARRG